MAYCKMALMGAFSGFKCWMSA